MQRWRGGGVLASGAATRLLLQLQQQQRRTLRTIVPPRPEVTTLVYLDHYGRVVQGGRETDVSFIRLRDNTFHLQRVLSDGRVIRWAAPGLAFLKHSSNFEAHSLADIDMYGGVAIPPEVLKDVSPEELVFSEIIQLICRVTPEQKLTRTQRRDEHRVHYAHWREEPGAFASRVTGVAAIVGFVVMWAAMRLYFSVRNGKPFWDPHVYEYDYDYTTNHNVDDFVKAPLSQRCAQFATTHPEMAHTVAWPLALSPGQNNLSAARSELQESEVTDPHFHNELMWKLQHVYHYGHWPKNLAA